MAEIKHIEAFEFYYAMGSARSYEKVAQEFHKSTTTIEKWGKLECWQEEVRYRDAETLRRNRECAIRANTKKIEEYKKINSAIIAGVIKRLKADALDEKGIKSYLDVARFDLGLNDLQVRDMDLLIGGTVEEQSAGDVNSTTENDKINFTFEIVKR